MSAPSCPGCRERDERLAALEARVRELEAQLGRNASNSSVPPSANPPQAPKPVVKPPTGKKRGAQPGHPPVLRRRTPPEGLREVIPFPKTARAVDLMVDAPTPVSDSQLRELGIAIRTKN